MDRPHQIKYKCLDIQESLHINTLRMQNKEVDVSA